MNLLCSSFKLFGLAYFIYLLISIGAVVGMVFLLKKFNGNIRKYINIALVVLGVLFVFLDMLGRMLYFKGQDIGENLPVNIYHIFVYFCIAIFITKKESLVKFGYFVMLPVILYTLIFVPDYYCLQESLSLSVLSFYIINIVVATFAILNLIWADVYLYKKDVLSSFVNYVIVIASIHIFNVFMRFSAWGVHCDYSGTLGENYDLFTRAFASILPKGYGSFVVVFPLILYVLGVGFLMVLPFDAIRNKNDKRLQQEQIIALGNFKAQQSSSKSGKSQILVRSENKAKPAVEKRVSSSQNKDGFVSVTKEVQVNKDKE